MARGDLTDEKWEVIAGLLPSEHGRKSRPAHDNRRFLNGMLHVLRVGLNAVAFGTRSMCASGAGRSKACGTRSWRLWWNWG